MADSIDSLTQYTANIGVLKKAENLQQGLVEALLPQSPPSRQARSDSSSFSAEALQALAAHSAQMQAGIG